MSAARLATRFARSSSSTSCMRRSSVRAFGSSPTTVSSASPSVTTNNPSFNSESYDHYQTDDMKAIAQGEPNKRGFTYLMLGGMRVAIATSGRVALLKLLDTMNASKDVLALASLEVDLSSIAVGDSVTVKWRGKPVFIRRRTAAEIAEAETADIGTMRDPEPDANRVKDPEWLVVLGICRSEEHTSELQSHV